ncbi:hypothetical protein FYZ35_03205 [Mobiluncus mulieris]|uniref:hypothetical protein n=1 Tax=Mobiluncus mulieris TaxID=2052 RepID=UPI00146FE476|nr:hypothetical protein [Mobiluncus mulieris]MCU9975120.1 hypothetical protein [Mobiluncus mulieris]MCV0013932.1 hypothetical protein [Mobiluncus mulieris]NMW80833.1 hypothetical protein [Mobiluncus mulieris]
MSGLLAKEIVNELRVEVSWIIDAITELSDCLKLSSYTLCLLRNRVEPEEAHSIERVIFIKWKNLESTSFETLRVLISNDFTASTQKPWTLSDEVLKELISLKVAELMP